MITLTMIFRFAYLVKDYDTNFISLHLNHAIHHNKTILPRICCLILTTPVYFLTRVKAINETWAPRCDLYFFITDYNLEEMTPEEIKFAEQIPIAPIENIKVGYEHLTQKSNLAFLFAYENYLNDSEWFIKADDDTYLIVEHLKTFLSKQNSSEPITFGYTFQHNKTKLPRICCLILTTPKYFLTRVKALNETWAPRCDRYFFITEYDRTTMTPEQIKFSEQIPIAPIKNIKAGYYHLTQKSNLAFLFAYENYLNDFEWFIKADDDTYLIVEHLKTFLSKQNSSEPITFGYTFQFHVRKGYHSGGASYVLSRESLRRFYEAHNDPAANCAKDGGAEDIEIARCLRKKGVYPGKALDKENRELFHPLPFHEHFHGVFPDWLLKRAANPLQSHYNCCSNQTISFHYVSPDEQYLMDFLLYRARV
ncbi:unnamed protein product [Rotaria sordida]|uniref:N-acetylgalactosaminide beta-1,3-galactosyltransferase n=1 Tax=Rotaria sordida TaxID=392033 RepID=A0A814S6A9_9BILA|nr:unnamed protein product [Rotaria sordida]